MLSNTYKNKASF